MLNCFLFSSVLMEAYRDCTSTAVLSLTRYAVILPINLQWSLCMHHVDNQISKLKRTMKNVLQPTNAQCTSSLSNDNVPQIKRINLEKVDSVVRVYRMLADKRHSVIDYYGVYIVFDICVRVYSLVLGAYFSWYVFVAVPIDARNYSVFIRLNVQLLYIILLALTCVAADKEVS